MLITAALCGFIGSIYFAHLYKKCSAYLKNNNSANNIIQSLKIIALITFLLLIIIYNICFFFTGLTLEIFLITLIPCTILYNINIL